MRPTPEFQPLSTDLQVRHRDGMLQFLVKPAPLGSLRLQRAAPPAVRVSWVSDGRFSQHGQRFQRLITVAPGVQVGGVSAECEVELVVTGDASREERADPSEVAEGLDGYGMASVAKEVRR